jgi:hypothetical protein
MTSGRKPDGVPPLRTEDVLHWLVHRPLLGDFGHKSPGYFQITGHQSLDAALQHARALVGLGCQVRGIWDRSNNCVMDEAAVIAKLRTA